MASVPGALHLRTLATINDLSSDQSNTIIFAVPLEVLIAVDGFGKNGESQVAKIIKDIKENKKEDE